MFERIRTIYKSAFTFGKSVASEVDGSGSASRCIGLIVATSTMGVLIAHVVMHHTLPDSQQLYGLSAVVTAGSAGYAANKIGGGPPRSGPAASSGQLPTPTAPSALPIVTPPEGGH